MEEIIKLWKEKNISHVDFNFSCGGDNMGDTDIVIYDNEGNAVECSEISDYIDLEIYKQVDFYVNSDGHYIGESGVVTIELEDDYFTYTKCATSEFEESIDSLVEIDLTDDEVEFIKNYVSDVNGDVDNNFNVNYKVDFILTDKHEKLLEELGEKVFDVVSSFTPDTNNEVQDYFNYESGDIVIENNKLHITITNRVYVFTESN